MKWLLLAGVVGALLHSATGSLADDYPSRPITMVVPLSAGGSTDVIARVMAPGMSKVLGQTVVVENMGGAGGTIAGARVAHATPDGYTFAIGQWGTNVATGAIYSLSYDLMRDFEPIGLIATQPFLITARKSLPADNLAQLIAWLRADDNRATAGNSGVGSPSHIAAVLFEKAVGANLIMVPYRGAGESTQALVGEQIDVLLNAPAISTSLMRSGQIKVYAVTSKQRLAMAPDIPTTDEAGLPGYYFSFWHAFWAPKGTPGAIVDKLNNALVETLSDPATRAKLIDLAQEIFPREEQSPEALRKFQQSEIDKWWPIIKAANVKPE
jgi:tripartite-type tricarboxylate transporter receptor subunit TctC